MRFALIPMHDDATNRLLKARFDFGQWTRPVSPMPSDGREIQQTESITRRALAELNVAFISAHSRRSKELRVSGVSMLQAGNRFPEGVYIPSWNERFPLDGSTRCRFKNRYLGLEPVVILTKPALIARLRSRSPRVVRPARHWESEMIPGRFRLFSRRSKSATSRSRYALYSPL